MHDEVSNVIRAALDEGLNSRGGSVGEQVVGHPVDTQAGGHAQREVHDQQRQICFYFKKR